MASDDEPFLKPGGRNLLLLCLIGIVMAIVSVSISLLIYHNTGDIYLDRSRPGYISEDDSNDFPEENNERFSSEGEITKDVLDEYVKEIHEIYDRLDSSSEAFSEEALSGETLGIGD